MKIEHMIDPKEEIKLSPEDEKIFHEKMTDLYNFCAERKMTGGAINFKDGFYFECTLVMPNKYAWDLKKDSIKNKKRGDKV